jgi:hypothetical protein
MMDPQPNSVFDVFLSHAHIDADLVAKLAAKLEDEAHFNIWLDKWVLVPGEHWQQTMAKALDEARTCAVCIGKQTPQGWFQEEIERALNRQTKDRSFRVIPLILPGADSALVDSFLELRTWVDFSMGLDNQDAFHLLISGIQGVPPGRGPGGLELHAVRAQLSRIRSLRREQLIDDDIALEY